MLSRMKNKLGTAGLVVAVVALVAALGGAAFAAVDKLSPQEKKEVKKIAKKFAGQDGAPGAQGPQGAPGAEGKQGIQGVAGQDGQDGEDGMCSEAQPECVAPSEATLTGVFSQYFNAIPQREVLSISYPLRVVPAPSIAVMVGANEFAPGVSFNPGTGEELALLESAEEVEALCPGNAAAPSAEPGVLCLYPDTVKTAEFSIGGGGLLANPSFGASPDPTSGGVFPVHSLAANGYMNGSWAVTTE